MQPRGASTAGTQPSPEAAAAAEAAGGGGGSSSSSSALTATGAVPPGRPHQPCLKPPLAPPSSHQRRAGAPMQGLQQSPLLGTLAWHPPGPGATPISTAMGAISWLRSLTTQEELACGSRSPGLARFVEAAGGEPARAALEQRVQAAATAVFLPADPPGGGGGSAGGGLGGAWGLLRLQEGLAQEHKQQGLSLYWHVLQAMLRAEEACAGLSAAGALLTRWPFHQCLLACAFECVAAAHRCCGLSFPGIPAKLSLAPFELTKFIAPFVAAEPRLPRELKRHMLSVDERILESLGWAAGSSLHHHLHHRQQQQQQQQPDDASSRQAGADVATQDQQQAVVQEAAAAAQVQPQPSRKRPGLAETDAFAAAAASSSKRQRSAQPSAGAADAQQTTTAQPAAHGCPSSHSSGSSSGGSAQQRAAAAGASDPATAAVFDAFCRKVLKLAAFRLVAVSEGLDFSPMPRDDVLTQAHSLLSDLLHGHTHLFHGRHLDTLLLCSLYGTCKAHTVSQMTFAALVERYKALPHCRQHEVLRAVPLQQDGRLVTLSTTDIIQWYNQVFVPAMKVVLGTPPQQQQQQQQAEAMASGSPAAAAASASGQPPKVSPVQLALQLSAPARSPAQGNSSAVGVASPSSSRTHRALALPPESHPPAGSAGSHSFASGLGLAGGLAGTGAAQQWLGEPVASGMWSPDLPPPPMAAGAAAIGSARLSRHGRASAGAGTAVDGSGSSARGPQRQLLLPGLKAIAAAASSASQDSAPLQDQGMQHEPQAAAAALSGLPASQAAS